MRTLAIAIAVLFCFTIIGFGQETRKEEKFSCSKNDKKSVRIYFQQLVEQKISDCENQRKPDATPRLIIAGKCHFGGEGCPLRLVKPEIPEAARRMRRSGSVKVKVVVDEEGKVIYSRMVEGDKIFRKAAEKAACKALFSSTSSCGRKIKAEYIILYNFLFE